MALKSLIIVAIAIPSGLLRAQAPANRYDSLFDQLMNLPQTTGTTAQVTNVTLRRDVGTFNLVSGRLDFFGKIDDRVVAAAFTGNGNFEYTPPTAVEREQLKRVLHSDSLHRSFSTLFLLFADSTAEELGR